MISLLGYGQTNRAFATYLHSKNVPYCVYDDHVLTPSLDANQQKWLPSKMFNPYTSSLEIVSPGIPFNHPLVMASKHLCSEYDYIQRLWQSNRKDPLPTTIFISGTNGKTTTTEMLGLLFKNAQVGGNIGTPLIQLYTQSQKKDPPYTWVLETSSFTLHYTDHLSPQTYILLPLAEDHLSWHGNYENYIAAKLKPLSLMDAHAHAFIHDSLKDHPIVQGTKAQLLFYQNSQNLAQKMGLDISKLRFKEPFLLDALLALSAAKLHTGVADYDLLNSYVIQPHRIEIFTDKEGYTWVDDSKATNVDATLKALECFQDNYIHLILGGDTKGVDLNPLFGTLSKLQAEVYVIGVSAPAIMQMAQERNIPAHLCRKIDIAVQEIRKNLRQGDVGMLSPSAASLDQFASYKHRGMAFKQCVLG
ncbi:UDP-N-acetylmuramoyl-L-alanine--D-glutamate ligase [Helicobacter ailurogastricus]|uniref:UDP-N-acetylmuramoylalanine--D-glutamate ligase n=1 Tax=Helicobacter ailurogastricus TaxID=1578720 RepID=A0A0K2XC99_9HELI|nr:UDP-N-acetylmuramoyl-L-alanine--D-glutamate ligase [Helicobacter ailurogastricus]CRF41565.1 UDP-N-acetylmuramoylalanine--D-glutamate ligase [Helicobacter ailurogastricus]CRF43248.1 UDP-N-acetylmuramoylalanine--D-glutamate ligase [Helicobacter ailurogastricus]CRF44950.1 UDP-N-acetylmuramoylalanine--D-glutamate ligase [Helicobacter ailurogastricus]